MASTFERGHSYVVLSNQDHSDLIGLLGTDGDTSNDSLLSGFWQAPDGNWYLDETGFDFDMEDYIQGEGRSIGHFDYLYSTSVFGGF